MATWRRRTAPTRPAWRGCDSDGHISDVLGCSITLADIRITQGRLTDALRTYQDALRLAEDDPLPVTRGTADMHVGISGVAYERNDLATAAHHLQLSRELGDAAGLPQNPYRWRAAEARLLAAQGDLPGAIEVLDEAEQVYFGDFAPNVRPVAARRTRLQLARGDLASATSWAAAHELAADGELSYMREFEHITLAMVLLAQHRAGRSPAALQVARRLLERLLAAADAGGRTGNVIEILVQLALASQAEGDRMRATDLLGRALALGERQGHVRVFLDAGPAWLRCCTASRRARPAGATRAQFSPPVRRNRRGATSLPAVHLRDRRSRSSTRSASGSSTFCGCSTATWVGPPSRASSACR